MSKVLVMNGPTLETFVTLCNNEHSRPVAALAEKSINIVMADLDRQGGAFNRKDACDYLAMEMAEYVKEALLLNSGDCDSSGDLGERLICHTLVEIDFYEIANAVLDGVKATDLETMAV